MSPQLEKIEVEEVKAKKIGFEQWLLRPEVKYMLSKIPAGDDSDLVRTVLEMAFQSGYSTGSGFIMLQLTKSVLSKRDEP